MISKDVEQNNRSILVLLFTLAFAWAFAWAFLTPFCGLVFHCGCTWPWAGGAEKCVGAIDAVCIQHTCPWCSDGKLGMWIPLGVMLLSQTLVISTIWWKYRLKVFPQLTLQILAAIVAFILSGYLEAVIHGLVKKYPR